MCLTDSHFYYFSERKEKTPIRFPPSLSDFGEERGESGVCESQTHTRALVRKREQCTKTSREKGAASAELLSTSCAHSGVALGVCVCTPCSSTNHHQVQEQQSARCCSTASLVAFFRQQKREARFRRDYIRCCFWGLSAAQHARERLTSYQGAREAGLRQPERYKARRPAFAESERTESESQFQRFLLGDSERAGERYIDPQAGGC